MYKYPNFNGIGVLISLEFGMVMCAICVTYLYLSGYPDADIADVVLVWSFPTITWILISMSTGSGFACMMTFHHKWKPVYELVEKEIAGEKVKSRKLLYYVCTRFGHIKDPEDFCQLRCKMDPRLKLISENGVDRGSYIILQNRSIKCFKQS